MIPIILAGGSGTRFWPLSRREQPKQFLQIFGDERSLIETTVDRLVPTTGPDEPIHIVCRPDLVEPTQTLLGPDRSVAYIEEPVARNTAPAIALATAQMEAEYGDQPLAFFPADHFIGDHQAFVDCLKFAGDRARRTSAIITLGIIPTRPETGYGYIECQSAPDEGKKEPYSRVERFVEKPPRDRAIRYLESGKFLWNAGIFVFRPTVLWEEFRRQHPLMWSAIDNLRQCIAQCGAKSRQAQEQFCTLEPISIDYAVMEDAQTVEVIPATFPWSDVGHWASLSEIGNADEAGNIVRADALLDEVSDSVIVSQDRTRLIAASGLQEMVIVDTEDALLVIPKRRAQRVRELVDQLERQHRDDLL